jgi:hypothetical protein
MTVAELIALLKSEDPTACVVVRGYEDGYDDVDGLERITIAPNADTNEWDGAFELSADGEAAVFLVSRRP